MITQTDELDNVVNKIFKLIPIIRKEIEQYIIQTLRDNQTDLSFHHFLILQRLAEENGQLHITKIGESMGIAKAQMTQSIDKLASLDLITRHHSESDRRKIMISLTNKGYKMLNQIDADLKVELRKKFQDRSRPELMTLSGSIQNLLDELMK